MPVKGKVRDLEKELDEGVTRPYEEIFCIVGMRADGSEKTVRISRKELLDVLARRAGPFWGVLVKPLEWRHLRRFCKEHGLDEMEIDSTLTYWENKKHLESLVADFGPEDRLDEWDSQQAWYLKNHALTNYIMHAREGKTVSKETGRPAIEFRFSLASYIVAQH